MRRRFGVLALSSVVLLGATACGGAKLDEVGPRFQQDVQRAFERFVEIRSLDGSSPTVKQDARVDIACADGKAKRVFEASVPIQLSAKLDDTLDNATFIALGISNGYSIQTQPDMDDLVRREMTMRADEYPATLKAVVVAAPVPTLTLSGETDCIDAG